MTDPKPRLGALTLGRRPRLKLVSDPVTSVEEPRVDAHTSGHAWARQYRAKLRVTDIGVIVVSVGVALIARFGVDDAQQVIGDLSTAYWAVSMLIVITWIAMLAAFHTRDSRVIGMGAAEYKQIVNASAVSFGLLAIAFLIWQVDVARGFFILTLPIGLTGLVLGRWLWRKWLLKQRVRGHYLARAIVVGNREDVEYVVSQIEKNAGAAYFVVGAALDSSNLDGSPGEITVNHRAVPVISDLDHVADAAASMGVETVVVAGQPKGGGQYIRNLGWELENTDAELVLSSRLTDVAGPRIHFRPVEGLPLIHVEIPHFSGAKHALKRILDIVVSGTALLLLFPVLLLIALLVRLDSHGPILFQQERCGRNQRRFQMIKFRSMVETAEDDLASLLDQNEANGVLFKIRNDPRITRVGRVLRKYSLDELPQLWNILVGDMSLVGPRPPLPAEVEAYESHVQRRLHIKPGLTGMWQVNGRSDLDWEESVRLDLYYVENWSLAGDIIIIWRTFKVLLRPLGAY